MANLIWAKIFFLNLSIYKIVYNETFYSALCRFRRRRVPTKMAQMVGFAFGNSEKVENVSLVIADMRNLMPEIFSTSRY